jgi:hypothetical protein
VNDDYSSYLLAIALIIIAVAGGFILLAGAGRRKRRSCLSAPVTGGSVSVFFDARGNAAIIPYVKDKFGSGRATADIVFIKAPYGARKLGAAIRTSMSGCGNAAPCGDGELFEKLGAHDWAGFSAGKRNISIYYKENYGIIFNTTRKKADGAYELNHNGVEKSLPPDTDDETLGSAVLFLLQKCR